MQSTEIINIEDYYDERETYARSNFMISSKYRSTLFSNRLMAISLSRLSSARESEGGGLVVTVKGKDIQEMIGAKGNAFFTQLSNTAHGMTGQTIGYSNPENQTFEYIAVVTKATYQNGEFQIEFHRDIKKYLMDLASNYTVFSLPVMLSFKSTFTFRLYELLKSKCFHRKGDDNTGNLFRIEFDINELRLDLGVVNSELDNVRRILNNTKGRPDYEKAVQASPEKLFSNWKDFKKGVIDKAVQEINATPESGLKVNKYESKKAGRGGKVYAVVFYVETMQKEKKVAPAKEMDEDLMDEIQDMIEGIRFRDAKAIGEAASWDIERIKRNYEYSKTKDVDDLIGFMIKAVKEDWASEKKISRKKSKASTGANSFDNFKSRDYDYDALMKSVMN